MKQDEEDMNNDNNQSVIAIKLKNAKQKFVNYVESDSDEMTFSDEEGFIDDEQIKHNEETDDKSDDDDPLPIEKANRKLKAKKQEEE